MIDEDNFGLAMSLVTSRLKLYVKEAFRRKVVMFNIVHIQSVLDSIINKTIHACFWERR